MMDFYWRTYDERGDRMRHSGAGELVMIEEVRLVMIVQGIYDDMAVIVTDSLTPIGIRDAHWHLVVEQWMA